MTLAQSYLFLGLAIVVEVIGTTALKATDNFTRLWPSMLTVVCYAASFYWPGSTRSSPARRCPAAAANCAAA